MYSPLVVSEILKKRVWEGKVINLPNLFIPQIEHEKPIYRNLGQLPSIFQIMRIQNCIKSYY